MTHSPTPKPTTREKKKTNKIEKPARQENEQYWKNNKCKHGLTECYSCIGKDWDKPPKPSLQCPCKCHCEYSSEEFQCDMLHSEKCSHCQPHQSEVTKLPQTPLQGKQEWEDEFYKHFAETKDGGCMNWTHETDIKSFISQAIQSAVQKEREETEKAYGGCHNCYGKGYSTHMGSEEGYGPIQLMDYCSCERGKQLKKLTSPQHP